MPACCPVSSLHCHAAALCRSVEGQAPAAAEQTVLNWKALAQRSAEWSSRAPDAARLMDAPMLLLLLLAEVSGSASLCQGMRLLQTLAPVAVPEESVMEGQALQGLHKRGQLLQLLLMPGKMVGLQVGRILPLPLPARWQLALCGLVLRAAQLPLGLTRAAGRGCRGGPPAAARSGHGSAALIAFSSASRKKNMKLTHQTSALVC